MSIVIFITVGTTSFPFIRLFKAVDQIISTIPEEPMLVVQTGNTEYKWKYRNITTYKYLSPPKMIQIIKIAEKIITHGGFGTMYMISKHNQYMPLIVARQKKFNEHVDDHQIRFIRYVNNKYSSLYDNFFITAKNLEEYILNY